VEGEGEGIVAPYEAVQLDIGDMTFGRLMFLHHQRAKAN
jgi:hypothetical protein